MPMIPFMEKFPETATRETRFASVKQRPDLPDGEYGFLEFYCNEPGCDCRRVIIQVLRPETGWSKVWATIGYGWEDLDFYRRWGGTHSDPVEMKGPYLDPLNPQSDYSPALLELFRSLIQSAEYVERFQRHYQMFRESVDGKRGHLRIEKTKQPRHIPKRRRQSPH